MQSVPAVTSPDPSDAIGLARAQAAAGPAVRHVALVLDAQQPRRFDRELVARLQQDAEVRVSVIRARAKEVLPGSLDLLLRLERMLYRQSGPRLSDTVDAAAAVPQDLSPQELARADAPDLVVDLCGADVKAANAQVVRVLYDGGPGWPSLVGALLAGRTPVVELEDVATGNVLARAVPCAENSVTISDALECVLIRVADLLVAAARNRRMLAPAARREAVSASVRAMVSAEAKSLARTLVKRLFHLCCYGPHWRTCWRRIDQHDLWDTRTLDGTSWNVIPDPGFRFFADPFGFVHEGRAYVFVEDLDHRTGKGVISVIPFGDNGPLAPPQPVLEEPWHLSYPFVFRHAGQIWMIPESCAAKRVALYRAARFPDRWVYHQTLVAGVEASDATLLHHADLLWMFATTRDRGSWSDMLSIFSSSDLHGPWQPHPLNPVLIDQASARPAGAMFARGGKLWRPVQDCTHGYGTGIGLAEITRLDHESYEQRVHVVLRPKREWPGRRFHTLNRAGRLELIDGSAYSPRNPRLAARLQAWSGRQHQAAVPDAVRA